MRLNITTITTSNASAFKEFLHPLSVLPNSTSSWRVRVIYRSKAVMEEQPPAMEGTCEYIE
jgi:hypothetical protein